MCNAPIRSLLVGANFYNSERNSVKIPIRVAIIAFSVRKVDHFRFLIITERN